MIGLYPTMTLAHGRYVTDVGWKNRRLEKLLKALSILNGTSLPTGICVCGFYLFSGYIHKQSKISLEELPAHLVYSLIYDG